MGNQPTARSQKPCLYIQGNVRELKQYYAMKAYGGSGSITSCSLDCRTIFFNLYSEGVESNWVHSALRPPIGLLCQPRVIMMMEKLVE
jgi:hypothetical protein